MRKHKALRVLSIVLALAALLMFTGGWVALKKEYRREYLQAALTALEDLSGRARAVFYQAEAEGSLSAKDMSLTLQTVRARAIDILEDGALTPPEGQYLLRKAVSIAAELNKQMVKFGGQSAFRRAVETAYPLLLRITIAYTVLYAAAIALPLAAVLQHLLKKRSSGIPALLCYLIWSVGAAAAVYYFNRTFFFSDVLIITAHTVLAPLCMLASVIVWRRGYRLYLKEHEAAVFASIDGEAAARRHIVIRPHGGACPRCGRAIVDGAAGCPECGQPLRDEPEDDAMASENAAPSEQAPSPEKPEERLEEAPSEPSQAPDMDAPAPPERPQAPEGPRGPEPPQAPEAPQTQEGPKVPDSPQALDNPPIPGNPQVPDPPHDGDCSQTPEDRQTPEGPQASENAVAPEDPPMPEAAKASEDSQPASGDLVQQNSHPAGQ